MYALVNRPKNSRKNDDGVAKERFDIVAIKGLHPTGDKLFSFKNR